MSSGRPRCFFEHFPRIGARYNKLADNFLAMVKFASERLWLRTCEFMA